MDPTYEKLLIISFFTLCLFIMAQGIEISSEPSDIPSSRPVSSPQLQPTHSRAPSNVRNMRPVSSPDQAQPAPSSQPNSASKPREYITYQVPFSWTSKQKFPHASTSQPSALSNPSAEGSSIVDPSTETRTKSFEANLSYQPTKRNNAAASTNPEIKRICDTTDHADLCVSFITPFFAEKSDTYSVLEMAIKASALQIRAAVAGIVKLARGKALIKYVKRSNLDDCMDGYDDALDNLQNAMDAIPNRDIGTILTMLSAAVTDFSDCDDFTPHFPPMAQYDDKLRKLVSNCLAIAASIK